jgi:hypothetical protein
MLLFEHANDHGGTWRADLGELLQRCTAPPGLRGQSAAMPASPACTFTMLKPLHSAFHSTALEYLLRAMETRNLAVVRLSSGMCVQMTATDSGTHARIQAMGTSNGTGAESRAHKEAVLYPLARSCSCAMRKAAKHHIVPAAARSRPHSWTTPGHPREVSPLSDRRSGRALLKLGECSH